MQIMSSRGRYNCSRRSFRLKAGIEHTAQSVIEHLKERRLGRVWLHVDLDVLDQSVMPAVDAPGSPGLTFIQLRSLRARLHRS
jgi:arginase